MVGSQASADQANQRDQSRWIYRTTETTVPVATSLASGFERAAVAREKLHHDVQTKLPCVQAGDYLEFTQNSTVTVI